MRNFALMTQKKRQISVILLILLFAFNYASNNLFFHTHIIDGIKVVHSHPYAAENHHHSRASVELISQAARLLYAVPIVVAIPFLVLSLNYTIVDRVMILRNECSCIYRIPRAPPV